MNLYHRSIFRFQTDWWPRRCTDHSTPPAHAEIIFGLLITYCSDVYRWVRVEHSQFRCIGLKSHWQSPPTPHHHHLHPPPEVLEKHGQFLSLLHTQDISILNQKMFNQKMKRDKSSEFKPSLHGTLFLFHALTWDIEQHLVWSPLL